MRKNPYLYAPDLHKIPDLRTAVLHKIPEFHMPSLGLVNAD